MSKSVSATASLTPNRLEIETSGLPLSLLNTLYPSVNLEGEITAASARLTISPDGLLPTDFSLSTTPVSGSSGEWAGSSSEVAIKAQFGTNAEGHIVPEAATINLKQLSGSRRGFIVRIPGLNIQTTRQDQEQWLNELRIHGVPGHLSAELAVTNWRNALPESGEFFAHGFDIATALRSLSLRGSDGTLRSLRIPQDLSAQLDGTLRIQESDSGYELRLDAAKLSNTTWLPWVQDAEMTLAGSSSLSANSLHTALHGAVRHGKFHILGHLTEIKTDDLIYGLALQQDENGLQVDDLFFAISAPESAKNAEDAVQTRQPLIHLSGSSNNAGAAKLKAIIDEIDIGWATTLPDVGIPSKVKIDGRARSVLDLSFDGKNTLTSEGLLFPIGVDVEVSSGRVQIENMSGTAKILPRSWLLRNGRIEPLTTESPDNKDE